MQFKVSIPNDRNLQCEKDFAKVKEKWREINIYQNLATFVFIPCVIVAFWRGSWNLLDHYHYYFPLGPTFAVSGIIVSILEMLRNVCISKHLKILDDDTRCTVFKKNVLLSLYDVLYNLANVAFWWVLWSGENGEFKVLAKIYNVSVLLLSTEFFVSLRYGSDELFDFSQ